MKTFSKLSLLLTSLTMPLFVMAQSAQNGQYLKPVGEAVANLNGILGLIYQMVFVLAIIAFVGGVAWFIYQKARGESPEKGFLMWGLIGLAVIFSFYGIIKIFQSVIGVGDNTAIPTTQLPRRG